MVTDTFIMYQVDTACRRVTYKKTPFAFLKPLVIKHFVFAYKTLPSTYRGIFVRILYRDDRIANYRRKVRKSQEKLCSYGSLQKDLISSIKSKHR